MNYLLVALLFCSVVYAAFISWCVAGWRKLKLYRRTSADFSARVSVIVPARNEENNIAGCMHAIISQDFPKELMEIIVIDDHSTDNTAAVVSAVMKKNIDCKILLLKNDKSETGAQFKKQAITKAIQDASGDLIVTTDADCIMNESWLSAIVSYYEKERPYMIAAPVCFHREKNNFEKLQSLEFSGLTGIGAGAISNHSPVMCNGANLAFPKSIFNEVKGFEGQAGISTGDDTQLMLKVAKVNPSKIHFLKAKEAIVYTSAAASLRDFFQQRKRWASKIPTKMNALTRLMGGIAYLLHAGLFFLVLCNVFYLFGQNENDTFSFLLFIFLLKSLPEFLLLNYMNIFYEKKNLLWLFLPAQFLYLFYITLIGPATLFGSYTWKGRSVKSSAVKFSA